MNGRLLFLALTSFAGFLVIQTPGRAQSSQISPERLDILDRRGYFTPAFKAAVHGLVDAKKAVMDAKVDELKLNLKLPDLQTQLDDSEEKVNALRKQFSDLDHADENDFAELQKKIGDASATLEEQRILAQAYVWAYPASPHQAEAQRDLQDVQKKIADQKQAEADAEAARVAAHAKLVQRAQARDLSIQEWRDLLLTMSKEDILKFLGPPQSHSQDDWNYTGAWTEDAVTHQKVGLDVGFNGGRVNNVTEASH